MSSTPLIMSVALEPKTTADKEKMGIALSKLAQEDTSKYLGSSRTTSTISKILQSREVFWSARQTYLA